MSDSGPSEHVDVGLPTRVKVGPHLLPDDGYPKIIDDQREMYHVRTVEEARAYWTAACGEALVEDKRQVHAYVSKSRWVADCPDCGSGIACWDENPQGCCGNCKRLFYIEWDPPTIRSHAIRLLHARPVQHRDWFPHKGDSVRQLAFENRALWGVDTVTRNGLDLPANVDVPDNLLSPVEAFDLLRTQERKKHRGVHD